MMHPHPGAHHKGDAPCTAAMNPAYYQYLLQHVGETPCRRSCASAGKGWSGR